MKKDEHKKPLEEVQEEEPVHLELDSKIYNEVILVRNRISKAIDSSNLMVASIALNMVLETVNDGMDEPDYEQASQALAKSFNQIMNANKPQSKKS